jgi:hypothetical protein
MKSVRYFQPYSTEENVVTNAVLLLLSHVHRLAPDLFEEFLTSFTDGEFVVGPVFGNQEKKEGGKSVVDAVIRQNQFEINVETKLGDDLDSSQIRAHIDGMKAESHGGVNVLLSITRSPLQENVRQEFLQYGQGEGITFADTTFGEIAEFFESRSEAFRFGLNEIISEFRVFITERGIVPESENRLLVNPCGFSIEFNRKYGIYHDQPERSKILCKYLGCYSDKAVRLVGEVKAVFLGEFEGETLRVVEQLELSWQEQRQPISGEAIDRITAMANEPNYYKLKDELARYYVVDAFVETEFSKVSKHGIQGHRYFSLDGPDGICPSLFDGDDPTMDELAQGLRKIRWQ